MKCVCIMGDNVDEDRANAHLIAASPGLYEACKLAHYVFTEGVEKWEKELAIELLSQAMLKAGVK